jgi:hypothetical protein
MLCTDVHIIAHTAYAYVCKYCDHITSAPQALMHIRRCIMRCALQLQFNDSVLCIRLAFTRAASFNIVALVRAVERILQAAPAAAGSSSSADATMYARDVVTAHLTQSPCNAQLFKLFTR